MSIEFSLFISTGEMVHITVDEDGHKVMNKDEKFIPFESLPVTDRMSICEVGMELWDQMIADRKDAGIAGDREAV